MDATEVLNILLKYNLLIMMMSLMVMVLEIVYHIQSYKLYSRRHWVRVIPIILWMLHIQVYCAILILKSNLIVEFQSYVLYWLVYILIHGIVTALIIQLYKLSKLWIVAKINSSETDTEGTQNE